MAKTMKDYVAAANEAVSTFSPKEVFEKVQSGEAAILDVREQRELSDDGAIKDALHIPRGILEPSADADAKPNDELLGMKTAGTPIYVLCASGARALLAAKTLSEMGYNSAVIKGGLKGWTDEGLPVA